MSDFMTTFLIMMSEATAFFAIIIIVFLVFRIRSGIASKQCAKMFVKRIKNEDPEHSNQLKNILLTDYGMDEDLASSAVATVIEQEHSLYSKIIELYLDSKGTALDDIDENVKSLTEVMHGVTINSSSQSSSASNTVSSASPESADEVQQLRTQLKEVQDEKEKVESELKEAMTRMEGMMTEFASMYAGGATEGDLKIRDKLENTKLNDKDNSKDDTESSQENSDDDLNKDVPDLDIDDTNK